MTTPTSRTPYTHDQLTRARTELRRWLVQNPHISVTEWPGWRSLDRIDWSAWGYAIGVYMAMNKYELTT